jgi:gluconokinase
MLCIIMGVAGSGKSTIGKLLRDRTGWTFYDADDFHPPENIDKMRRAIPLNDEDRRTWLFVLQGLIARIFSQQEDAILACSALKEDYRQILQRDYQDIVWIYLRGDYDFIINRIEQRQGHFFPKEVLRSQFAILEEPETALTLDISLPPAAIADKIFAYLVELGFKYSNPQ